MSWAIWGDIACTYREMSTINIFTFPLQWRFFCDLVQCLYTVTVTSNHIYLLLRELNHKLLAVLSVYATTFLSYLGIYEDTK